MNLVPKSASKFLITRSALAIALSGAVLVGCGRLIPAQHQSLEPEALEAGAFVLDPAHASLIFAVDHLGFSLFKGRFDRIEASLDFDPENPEASRLDAIVDMSSLSIHLPAFEEELKGEGWLDVERHPIARFRSREIEAIGERTGVARGELDFLGVVRPFELEITFRGGAENFLTGAFTLGFSATGELSRSAHGLDALVPAIGDAVMLEIEAEFVAAEG